MRLIRNAIIAWLLLAMLCITTMPAFATQPFQYPVPLTCTRNFYVRPAGHDTSGCGTADTDVAACQTMQGADANITGLTGGDCVKFAPGTYNTNGHLVLSKSGTANQANGYITYIGAPSLASKIFWNSPTFFGALIAGNYVAMVGFEFDGNNLQGFTGYNASSNNTYNAQNALFDPQGSGHHHMFFNNKMHGSGGAALTSTLDYEVAAGNEIYDMAGTNPCGASGISVYEPVPAPGFTPSLPWDTDPLHFKYINNIIHDVGMTAQADAQRTIQGICPGEGHADGNGLILDDWGRAQNPCNGPAYPYGALISGNTIYHVGGRGLFVLSTGNFGGNGSCPSVPVTIAGARTFINNTVYDAGLDPSNNGGDIVIALGAVNETWKNNIAISSHGEVPFTWTTAGWQDNGSGNPMANNLTFTGTPGQNGISIDNSSNSTYFLGSTTLEGVDPKLVNLTGHNFHPLPSSPVINAGSALPAVLAAFPVNLTPDGLSQPSPPDVGAFTTGVASSTPGPVNIAAGGAASAPYVADAGFNGGLTITNNPSGAVDTSLVPVPAPTAVYRSERYGTFFYVISSLTPGAPYTVTLHFTEDFWSSAGQRIMNASLNGTQVITNLDIFAAAGAQHKAIVRSFTQTADSSGNITVSFAPAAGSPDANAKVDAIQVQPQAVLSSLTLSASTFVSGNAQGTVIGNIVGTSPGSTVTVTSQSTANAVQAVLVGSTWQLQVGSGATTGAQSYTFSLVETLAGASGSPKTTTGFSVTETATVLAPLTLSAATFQSGGATGTVIGNILGTSPGSTVTVTSQSTANGVQVALVSGVWQLQVGSGALMGSNSYTFSLVETLSGATGSPKTTAGFVVTETAGTLTPLSLPSATFLSGSSTGTVIGNVQGTTPGSTVTITGQSVANAVQIAQVGSVWQVQVGSGALTGVNSYTFSLVETLSGATGSPKTTAGVVVNETVPALVPLTLSASTFLSGATTGTVIGNVVGATPGSTVTITSQSVSNAVQIAQVGAVWQVQVGSGALTGAQTYTFNLVETLSGATGSPKTTTSIVVTETAIVSGPSFLSAPQMFLDSNVPANLMIRDRNGQNVIFGTVDSSGHLLAFYSRTTGDTTTAVSPGTGKVGEQVSQTAATQAIANATPTNVTSKSIPAGHWRCNGYLKTNPAGSTTQSSVAGSISATTATMGTGIAAQIMPVAVAAGLSATLNFGPAAFDFSTPTTLYVVGNVAYATSTLTADAGLFCIRIW